MYAKGAFLGDCNTSLPIHLDMEDTTRMVLSQGHVITFKVHNSTARNLSIYHRAELNCDVLDLKFVPGGCSLRGMGLRRGLA